MQAVKTKKELSPAQREELLKVLKARFEKNMNRHEVLEWAKVQATLEGIPKNSGRSTKWKQLAVNPMLLVTITRRVNTSFLIVQRKVQKVDYLLKRIGEI